MCAMAVVIIGITVFIICIDSIDIIYISIAISIRTIQDFSGIVPNICSQIRKVPINTCIYYRNNYT